MAGGQNWTFDADGGYFANPSLSRELRHAAQPMTKMLQFVSPIPPMDGMGKGVGDTIDFDKVSNVAVAGKQLSEDEPMPETKITIRKDSMTVTEWGNSVPYTGKLEALSQWDPSNPIQKALLNDQVKTFDAEIAKYFKAASVYYIPMGTAGSPTGIFVAGSTGVPTTDLTTSTHDAERNAQLFDVKGIRDYLFETLLVDPWDGTNYICVGSTRFMRGIKNDTEFIDIQKYAEPSVLLRGEIGMTQGVRFVEVNNVAAFNRHGDDTDSDSLPDCGEAVFFGADAVAMGTVIAPELRAESPADFGRSKKLGWYGLLGFGTPWRFHNDSEARMVWVTSHNNALGPPTGY